MEIKTLLKKYQSLINYAVFGVLTTAINILTYAGLYNRLHMNNIASNVIAWILAVSFAFVTNKLWVFQSKNLQRKVVVQEICSFFLCRLATGLLDLAMMYVFVDVLSWNGTVMKCISNVIVIVANYIASKLVVFRTRNAKKE